MDFLFSNLPPIKTRHTTFADAFYSLIPEATQLDIVVGYITADSLAELKQTITFNNNLERLNLIIGMHRWDKFTKLEYNAAISLNEYLTSENRGEVRLVIPFRFHGKLYLNSNGKGPFAGIIGSNNLSSIIASRTRIYEASSLFRESEYAIQMKEFIEQLSADATENINNINWDRYDFKEQNKLLEDHEDVEQVPSEELADCLSKLTPISFEIPLVKNGKVPKNSNLNAFFGKGRENKTSGFVQPRHWYEVELIVPSSITQQAEYPQKNSQTAVFDVITDDGWKFSCKVSGDNSKNFRSYDDLKILGRWVKGRLENAGVLEVGQHVTQDTFTKYGRDTFTLTKTTTPNLWFIDFGVY